MLHLRTIKVLLEIVDILGLKHKSQQLLVNCGTWRTFVFNSRCVGSATLSRRSSCVFFLFSGLQRDTHETHHSGAILLSLTCGPCGLDDVHLFQDLFLDRSLQICWEQFNEDV